jgi:hypothetical protein
MAVSVIPRFVRAADLAGERKLAFRSFWAAAHASPEAPATTATPRSSMICAAPPPMPPATTTVTPMSARKFGRYPGLWPGFGTDFSETILSPSASNGLK